MIFKSISLHNLFSYYGTQPFDLSPSNNDQENIVVIMGRNGYGKTSFLNSIKLLFGGVTKELRQNVQRNRLPSAKAFVLGDKDWWGILNHKARVEGDFICSVSAILLNEKNQEIEIKRSWNLSADNYQDHLTVVTSRQGQLNDEAAQHYLSAILPQDYIPFFFFDAEDIGYLAEANSNQMIEKMEQLLDIRPADNLRDCIKELTNNIERKSIADDAQLKLFQTENRLQEISLQSETLQRKHTGFQADIDALEDEQRDIKHKIQLLSGHGTIENNARLEAEKKAELKKKEQALTALSEAFEGDAFLRLNAKLIKNVIPVVDQCANGLQSATNEMLVSLKGPLREVFTTPPHSPELLSKAQVAFYQQKISKLLDSRDIENENDLFQLDSVRAKKMLNLLTAYTPQHTPEIKLSDDLASALKADKAIYHIDKTLEDVAQLSEESKQQLLQFQDQQTQLQETQLNYRDQVREIEHKLTVIQGDNKPLEKEAATLRQQARESKQGNAKIDLLGKMQFLLTAYKQQLKEQQREKLEKFFNTHLHVLLDSNNLIAKVKIDKSFELHYLDANANAVAMSSISAGMKQLSATALLWALKDASGKKFPIIIDTPLGRIDKQHQENILARYYPQVARQVILLPTDSELDERKLDLLRPHIYREYMLTNEGGESTQLQLIHSSKEATYG